jgi:hypothetical protein
VIDMDPFRLKSIPDSCGMRIGLDVLNSKSSNELGQIDFALLNARSSIRVQTCLSCASELSCSHMATTPAPLQVPGVMGIPLSPWRPETLGCRATPLAAVSLLTWSRPPLNVGFVSWRR